ncbi:retropepsin-like aspartic protease [Planctomycetota bacterium]
MSQNQLPRRKYLSLGRTGAWWVLYLLVLAGTGCHTSAPPRESWTPKTITLPDTPLTVPLILDSYGLAYVDVSINDQGPYRLLVDTGTYGLHLAHDLRALADTTRQKHSHVWVENARGHSMKSRYIIQIQTLSMGTTQLVNLNALVQDRESLVLTHKMPYDGILGIGAFYNHLFMIDFPRRQLILTRGRLETKRRFVTPAINAPRDIPRIRLEVLQVGSAGYACDAVIDTGTNTMHLPERAKSWSLPRQFIHTATGYDVGGRPYQADKYQVEAEFVLGDTGCRFYDPVLQYSNAEGRVGVNILSEMIVILDQRHRRIALVPNAHRDLVEDMIAVDP